MKHQGGCHCRNLRYEFATPLALGQLPLRACQCSFCRKFGALSTSDPQGTVRFHARDAGALIRYRFGLRLADFLVCGRCGVYVAAVMEQGGRRWTVLNANTLDEARLLTQPVTAMDYAGETEAQRVARRTARWTPVP